jgi:hypothetical protein
MTRSTSPPQIQNKSKLCRECYIAETPEKKCYFAIGNLKIFHDAKYTFLFCGFIFDLFRVYLTDKDGFLFIVMAWRNKALAGKCR